MTAGVTGRILRVNLTEKTTEVESPSEVFYRTYFGGRALIAYYLLKETDAQTQPLSPENKVIFSAGPLTGAPLAGAGRSSVGTISPLTGGYGDSEAGGFWGAELKRAGYDAIIIEGKAASPVYLAIQDDTVEIRDAGHIWGTKTTEAEDIIKGEMGDKRARVCQIGLAGERQIPYACVVHDLTHFAGRTGTGAVLGYKNLRAIAVRGTKGLEMGDPEKVKELSRWMGEKYKKLAWGFSHLGTPGVLMPLQSMGGLPTRNFREGAFEGAEKISGETMRETVLIGQETCYACPIKCKRVVSTGEPHNVDPRLGGPEYETLGALGSVCGIDDLEAICKGNELCNSYGLDTISTGVSIAFAMECFEEGILTEEDTGGLALTFGNAAAMLEMIEQIVQQKGLGKILSKGVKEAAKVIGKGSEKYAMHVKGQEVPMHEPRLKMGLGIGYAVSPTGADHCHNLHDTIFEKSTKGIASLGVLEPLPAESLGPEKVRMFTYVSTLRHFGNCALYCYFVPWSPNQVVDMMQAVTGWDVSLWELMKVGERAAALTRLFNIRRGFTAEEDRLKKRFHEAFTSGPLQGVKLEEDTLQKAVRLYYGMMGWDEKGVPSEAKLHELDLGWAV
jgi:aldehyde:ferredoxin oxidoreductase